MQDASNFAFVVRAVLLLPAWMQTNTSNFQASLNQNNLTYFPVGKNPRIEKLKEGDA